MTHWNKRGEIVVWLGRCFLNISISIMNFILEKKIYPLLLFHPFFESLELLTPTITITHRPSIFILIGYEFIIRFKSHMNWIELNWINVVCHSHWRINGTRKDKKHLRISINDSIWKCQLYVHFVSITLYIYKQTNEQKFYAKYHLWLMC